MKNETALGHVLTLMTIIIWGTTFVSTKVLLEAFTPIEILFFRFTLGYLSLWAIYPRKGTYGTLRQELLFAAAGLCGVTLYFLLENIALTYTFASNVGVIISIAPFFTAFLANWLLDGEPLRKRFFVGFAAALTGIILIGLNGNFVLKLNPVGDILATLAAVVWACIMQIFLLVVINFFQLIQIDTHQLVHKCLMGSLLCFQHRAVDFLHISFLILKMELGILPEFIQQTYNFIVFVMKQVVMDQCIYLSDNLKQLPVFPVYQFNSRIIFRGKHKRIFFLHFPDHHVTA